MELNEQLRAAFYATDDILAGRPPDAFVVAMQATDDKSCFYVAAFRAEMAGYLRRTRIRAEAMVYTFTEALDVAEAITDGRIIARVEPL